MFGHKQHIIWIWVLGNVSSFHVQKKSNLSNQAHEVLIQSEEKTPVSLKTSRGRSHLTKCRHLKDINNERKNVPLYSSHSLLKMYTLYIFIVHSYIVAVISVFMSFWQASCNWNAATQEPSQNSTCKTLKQNNINVHSINQEGWHGMQHNCPVGARRSCCGKGCTAEWQRARKQSLYEAMRESFRLIPEFCGRAPLGR